MSRPPRASRGTATLHAAIACLLVVASLPLILPSLDSFFTFDDLHNLRFYVRDPWGAAKANLLVVTSFRRPLGALLYLPLFETFGLNPYPYYCILLVLFSANTVLVYSLLARLTRNPWLAALATALASTHPAIVNVTFNFGALFELFALAGMLGALHAYISFLESRTERWRWYALLLLCFAVGLNAKELAAILPAVLLLYELVYRDAWRADGTQWRGIAGRLGPLFGISLVYTAGKVLGEGAMWRDNVAYQYQADTTFYLNLAPYLEHLSFDRLSFNGFAVAAVLGGGLGLALLLRSRHMLFGGGFALLALLPVLPLPRVWALFLYAPLVGLGLYLSAFAFECLARLPKSGERAPAAPGLRRTLASFGTLAVTVALLVALSYPHYHVHRGQVLARRAPWRTFAHQLWALYPEMPNHAALAFEGAPFPLDTWDKWGIHMLVWLEYEQYQIRIFRIPQQSAEFREYRSQAPEAHFFRYVDEVLIEEPFEDPG